MKRIERLVRSALWTVIGGLTYTEFEKYGEIDRGADALRIQLFASDPVGKRIDPGTQYLPDDRFYPDFRTKQFPDQEPPKERA